MLFTTSHFKRSLVSLLTLTALMGISDVVYGMDDSDEAFTPKERYKRIERENENEENFQDFPPKKDDWFVNFTARHTGSMFEYDEAKLQEAIQENQPKKQKAASAADQAEEQNRARAERLRNRKANTVVPQEQVNKTNRKIKEKKRPRSELTLSNDMNVAGKRGLPIYNWEQHNSSDSNDDSSNSTDLVDSTQFVGIKLPKLSLDAINIDEFLAMPDGFYRDELDIFLIVNNPTYEPPVMELPVLSVRSADSLISDEGQAQTEAPKRVNVIKTRIKAAPSHTLLEEKTGKKILISEDANEEIDDDCDEEQEEKESKKAPKKRRSKKLTRLHPKLTELLLNSDNEMTPKELAEICKVDVGTVRHYQDELDIEEVKTFASNVEVRALYKECTRSKFDKIKFLIDLKRMKINTYIAEFALAILHDKNKPVKTNEDNLDEEEQLSDADKEQGGEKPKEINLQTCTTTLKSRK